MGGCEPKGGGNGVSRGGEHWRKRVGAGLRASSCLGTKLMNRAVCSMPCTYVTTFNPLEAKFSSSPWVSLPPAPPHPPLPRVVSPEGTYTLQAETEFERAEWIAALQVQCSNVKVKPVHMLLKHSRTRRVGPLPWHTRGLKPIFK